VLDEVFRGAITAGKLGYKKGKFSGSWWRGENRHEEVVA
jgi:hypothetical protein